MTQKFTQGAQNALINARSISSRLGHFYIGTEHILMGIMSSSDSIAAQMLSARGLDASTLEQKIRALSGQPSPQSSQPAADGTTLEITPLAIEIIENAVSLASPEPAATHHILMAIINADTCVAAKITEQLGLSLSGIKRDIEHFMHTSPNGIRKKASDSEHSDSNDISKYSRDLTDLASKGQLSPLIGRKAELDRVIRILCRKTKNNPCLIGDAGVGKTAIVEGLAEKISTSDIPDVLKGKRILSLDLGMMISGAKYRGEFEERLKYILTEATKDKSTLLFVDELHTVVGAGAAEGALDAANILKPALSRGEIQLIGATTVEEYRKNIERDPALERRFQTVNVSEPTRQETIDILRGIKSGYEKHHGIKITQEAIEAAADMSARYITDRHLPDKAIDILDEAASALRLDSSQRNSSPERLSAQLASAQKKKTQAILSGDISEAKKQSDIEKSLKKKISEMSQNGKRQRVPALRGEHIAQIITRLTGIPVSKIMKDDSQRLIELSHELSMTVIGQTEAINELSRAIRRGRTGLKDPSRPIGSFIFAGDTGVGKTHLCRALAQSLFGSERALIRIDMSEYMEKHSVSRLIGAPPGYVGHGDGGQLTERVRRTPYSIVLLDEIEKAHPDVLNILLQVLDDGILTDSCGRRVDFKNTVIIMTTNAGSNLSTAPALGFASNTNDTSSTKHRTMAQIKRTFPPEFINRVDNIIIFSPLSTSDLASIAALKLSSLSDRLKKMNITLTYDSSVCEYIADLAHTEGLGARPVARIITELVEDKISDLQLSDNLRPKCSIHVSVKNNTVSVDVI